MDLEKLHFKIGLSATYWDKKPIYSIAVNDQSVVASTAVSTESDEIFYAEFDCEVAEGPVSLKIRLENKDESDTIQNEDKTEILKDILFNIVSVNIEEVELGTLIYSKSIFTGDNVDRPVLDNCINLGWNGTWELKFDSPFYIWLLENI
jgi:hypothetical protein